MPKRKAPKRPEKRFRLKDKTVVGLYREHEKFGNTETTRLFLKNEKGKMISHIGFDITETLSGKGMEKIGEFNHNIETRGKPLLRKEKSYRGMGCAETLIGLSLKKMKKDGVKRVEIPTHTLNKRNREPILKILKKYGFKEAKTRSATPLIEDALGEEKLKELKKMGSEIPLHFIEDIRKINLHKIQLPLREVKE